MKTIALAAIITSVTAGAAFAGTPWIEKRQYNQIDRIAEGAGSGQLTPRETERLWKGQQRIDNAKTQAEANGVVTFRERARIHRMQTVQGARIFWKRHN
jgi:hypothetical protein